MTSGYSLYEHRQDESVLIVARILQDGSYECRRWRSPEEDAFILGAETFLSIYKLRSRPNA